MATPADLLPTSRPLPRRAFFRAAGATAATSALLLAGCGKNNTPVPDPTTVVPTLTYVTGDTGLLDYLYSLAQLQYAFYDKVVHAFPADMPAEERAGFTDLRDHALIYGEFFRYIIGSTATVGIPFNFDSLTLSTRTGVLTAARQFADLSVAAYTDAGRRVQNGDYLLLLGKIASAKARHAAYVRDLLTPNSFADDDVVVAFNGFSGFGDSKTPAQVVAVVAPYFTIILSVVNFA